jgi:polar amino acid transport system substrate-binding protein
MAGLDVADFRARYPDMLSAIVKSSARIDGIIKNLKEFSRDAPGQDMRSIDLNTVIRSAIELVSGYIKRATGYFNVDYESALPRVKGNAQRLEQVVINLLLNACQALTARDQAITVCSRAGEGRRSVRMEVRDDGAGIPQEHLARIREPFFTTKKAMGGTGLGLYVSEAIVTEHSGSLSFISEPGRGTTAVVALPANMEK